MRPGQNKRMRGRPTNNRRGPNPLTRSLCESNGPDVKIRGNAHHVAEKYLQLARDAHTGGDPVAAENYLQHAEHYFRLIAAAQAAQALAQSGQARPAGERQRRRPGRRRRFRDAVGSFCVAVERDFTAHPISNRNRVFNRSLALVRARRNPLWKEIPMRSIGRGRTIEAGTRIVRSGKATAFLNVVRDRIGRLPSVAKITATTDKAAMVGRGSSGRTAIPRPSPFGTSAPMLRPQRRFLLS